MKLADQTEAKRIFQLVDEWWKTRGGLVFEALRESTNDPSVVFRAAMAEFLANKADLSVYPLLSEYKAKLER